MRFCSLLWLLLLPACTSRRPTSTVLTNVSARPLRLSCVADTADRWHGLRPERLRYLQAAYAADTCLLVLPTGRLLLVKTLASGDCLNVGNGREAWFSHPTPPPLDWDTITVQADGHSPLRLTAATLPQLTAGPYEEHYPSHGEQERIVHVYRVPLPARR